MFDTKSRKHTDLLLSDSLKNLSDSDYSDILLTNVHQTGTLKGIDISVMNEEIIKKSKNPIIISGGLNKDGRMLLDKYKKSFPNLSGIASSTSIFQYSEVGLP